MSIEIFLSKVSVSIKFAKEVFFPKKQFWAFWFVVAYFVFVTRPRQAAVSGTACMFIKYTLKKNNTSRPHTNTTQGYLTTQKWTGLKEKVCFSICLPSLLQFINSIVLSFPFFHRYGTRIYFFVSLCRVLCIIYVDPRSATNVSSFEIKDVVASRFSSVLSL